MGDRKAKAPWWDDAQIAREQRSLERMKLQLRINLTDAEHECEHGEMRTSLSKPDPCGCWPDGAVVALGNRGFIEEPPEFEPDEPATA